MFILAKKRIGGYRQGQKTTYSSWHLGTDWKSNYEPLYAPFDGHVTNLIPYTKSPKGGNTIWFKPNHDGTLHRYLHMSKFLVGLGPVKKGTVLGITGGRKGDITSGLSDAPHTHNDVSEDGVLRLNKKSNFIDPEKYNWEEGEYVRLVNDKGTVYLVTGNKDKRKIGIADPQSLGLFGDEPQEAGSTVGIPEYQTIVKGQIINK